MRQPVQRPDPEALPQHLCLDKAYDNPTGTGACVAAGYIPHIRRIGEEKLDGHSSRVRSGGNGYRRCSSSRKDPQCHEIRAKIREGASCAVTMPNGEIFGPCIGLDPAGAPLWPLGGLQESCWRLYVAEASDRCYSPLSTSFRMFSRGIGYRWSQVSIAWLIDTRPASLVMH